MVCCALIKWLRRNSKKKDDEDDTIGYVPSHYYKSVPAVEGLSESIQLLLAYGNKSQEDVTFKQIQLEGSEQNYDLGGEPLLEVHKKRYSQSTAISRYLGKRFGLAGADPFEDLEIDQIVEAFNDFRIKLVSVQCELDTELRQAKLVMFRNEAPRHLDKFDAVIAANNGHLALGKLTWADFVLAGLWDVLKSVLNIPNIDVKYPNISALVSAVLSIPGVREVHNARRQQT